MKALYFTGDIAAYVLHEVRKVGLKSANEYKIGVLNLLLATEGSAAGRVSPVRTPAQRKGKTKARTIKGTRAVRGRRR